jgi:hypothetical protein
MNLEVDSAVLKLLTGEVARSANLSVIVTNAAKTIREVRSEDFTQEDLDSMFKMVLSRSTIGNPSFRVTIRHTTEKLNGTEISCKLSISALEAISKSGNKRHNVSLKLFGPTLHKEGELMTFQNITLYFLLVALSDSPNYSMIKVFFNQNKDI